MNIWQRQIIRYTLVGVLSTSAYIAIALLLLYVFDMSLLAANICAFFVPMAISYFGNALWSFEAKGEFRSFGKFSCVSVLTLTLMVVSSRSVSEAGLPPYFGILIVAVAIPVISFLLQKLWVFNR
jgi:putative flippase GtrA